MQYATCHTDGCHNSGHAVPLDFIDPANPPDVIVCGACGQTITDVRDGDPA